MLWSGFNRFAGFFESASLMNEGRPKNREHWVQIITTIPEISSSDHSYNRTTDKRIPKKSSFLRSKIPTMKGWALFRLKSCFFTLIFIEIVGYSVGYVQTRNKKGSYNLM